LRECAEREKILVNGRSSIVAQSQERDMGVVRGRLRDLGSFSKRVAITEKAKSKGELAAWDQGYSAGRATQEQ